MRTASSLALLAILGAGCHTVIGHDPSRDSAPAVPDARVESRPSIDLPSRDTPTMHDQSPTDAPGDLPQPQPDVTLDVMQPDVMQPDLMQPDTLPSFSTTSCQKLWLDSPVVQLSTKGGGRPAIVTVGQDFYVVYGEGGQIQLHRVTPTADLGATVIGSSNTMKPTVAVTRATGAQLGVVWENATVATGPCPSNLLFASFDVPISGGTPTPAPAPITSSSCASLGYRNPSLVHTGTQYAVEVPAQYSCSNAIHYKSLAHAFNPTSIAPPSACVNGAPDTYTTVVHKISGARYAAAHLWRSTTVGSPFMITLFRNNGMTAWGSWAGISTNGAGTLPVGLTLPGTSLTEHRPALTSLSDAATGDTVHLAWMASDEKLRTHSCTWAVGSSAPLACTGAPTLFAPANLSSTGSKYSHPALAASPDHGNLLLLAYALDSKEIGISKLAEGSWIAPSPVQQLVTRNAVPRYTALAAHPQGFGLVWVEVVNNTEEVFFKWIGCLP